jgi:hypothetical protein
MASITNDLGLIEAQIVIEGIRPLLMHRGNMANPLDPHAKALKALSGKRGKTEQDLLEIAETEWRGGLYWSEELGPYLPAEMLEASIVAGGKKHKLGTAIKQAVQIIEDAVPLEYDGPRDIEGLMAAGDRFYMDAVVKVGMAKVVRRRPIFHQWKATFNVEIDPTVLDVRQVELAVNTAGRLLGMGDWRPRYGRFVAKVSE